MKKRLIILFVSILIIYIFNIKFFNDIYYIVLGNYYYSNWDYEESINYHKNISLDNKNFFLWWDYYKLWKYEKSLQLYNQSIKTNFKEKYKIYNNIWNIYYKFSQNISNKKEKLNFLYKSKDKYKLSLDLKENNYKAKNNYFFILSLIQRLETKKENNNQKNNNINNLSDFNNNLEIQDEYDIENYLKKLKKEEKYNKQFLNIKTIDNNFDLVNSYFYEKLKPISSDSNNLEKDW